MHLIDVNVLLLQIKSILAWLIACNQLVTPILLDINELHLSDRMKETDAILDQKIYGNDLAVHAKGRSRIF